MKQSMGTGWCAIRHESHSSCRMKAEFRYKVKNCGVSALWPGRDSQRGTSESQGKPPHCSDHSDLSVFFHVCGKNSTSLF